LEYRLIDVNGNDSLRQISDVLSGDDFDGDHFSNFDEFIAGTDPVSALSLLRLTSVTQNNQSVLLQWIGGTNATQYIERSTSLGSPWAKILTNNPPTPVTNQFTDPNLSNRTNYFYRVRAAR
jgi:hypothetical protein